MYGIWDNYSDYRAIDVGVCYAMSWLDGVSVVLYWVEGFGWCEEV